MLDSMRPQFSVPQPELAERSAQFDPLFGALGDDGWFPSPAHIFRRAAILDAFSSYPAGHLLEMGCGAGRLLVDWHRLGHSGEACDPDAESRQMARQCVESFDAKFEVRDRPTAASFDYLVSTEVLEHLEDPADQLAQWTGFVRPGGTVLLTVPAFRNLWGASDEWAGHVQRFEPDAFLELAQSVGLKDVRLRLYGYPIGDILRIGGNFAAARRNRAREPIDRHEATLASGRDRKTETRLAPLLRSPVGRAALQLGITLQRKFDRGHGLLLIGRK